MSCGEASFDQASSRTPESASGSSMASDSGLGAAQSLHSHPSSNHQSPTVKQHDELNLYDQVVISNPRSNYDNIHLQHHTMATELS